MHEGKKMKFAGFGGEYFKSSEEEESKDAKPSLVGYKKVLNSKTNEETLVSMKRS